MMRWTYSHMLAAANTASNSRPRRDLAGTPLAAESDRADCPAGCPGSSMLQISHSDALNANAFVDFECGRPDERSALLAPDGPPRARGGRLHVGDHGRPGSAA